MWLSQARSSTAKGNGVRPDTNAMRGTEQEEMSCMGTAMDVTCSYDGGDTGNRAADAAKGHRLFAHLTEASPCNSLLKLSYHWHRYACIGMTIPASFTGEEASVSSLQQLGALLLLISPFFFWGTSMVAMKVSFLACSTEKSHASHITCGIYTLKYQHVGRMVGLLHYRSTCTLPHWTPSGETHLIEKS